MTARALVVAGVASGVGKTSLTLGLLEALRRRGLAVQAFKVGPDFIDPQFHALVTGRPSHNLDGWMCGRDAVLATVARRAAGADVVVVEGMMGCFDGVDGSSEVGSTAEVAKWLGAPVVLVLDAGALSRSAAAVALGFERLDAGLRVAAVVANRVGGPAHAGWVRAAISAACRAEMAGAIPFDAALTLPERHLGLVTDGDATRASLGPPAVRAGHAAPATDRATRASLGPPAVQAVHTSPATTAGPLTPAVRARLAEAVERFVDVDRLLALAAPLRLPAVAPAAAAPPRARLGVACDAAFHFYYAENLDRLREAGAELVAWSPLAGEEPPEVDGLYVGGGYPEVHAAALAAHSGMLEAVRRFAESGRPVYAECGGLMLLAEGLEDAAGVVHPMAGVLPARVSMRPGRLTLGYAQVTLAADTPLGPAGTVARGQEFHASTLDPVPARVPRVYRVESPGGAAAGEGYLLGRTLASYVHLHFASNPRLAPALVDACVQARG